MSRGKSRPRSSGIVLGGVITLAVIALSGVFSFMLLKNPFSSHTVDRSAPVVLKSLTDLTQYHAASGQFEVLVDLEKDVKYLPSAVAGERTFFVGVGSVDAYVDFGKLDAAHLTISADHKGVTVKLPAPEMATPVIDYDRSHVAARKRGLLDRLGGVFADAPTSDQPLYVAAQSKIAGAAAQSELSSLAMKNTRAMLSGLLGNLGYSRVDVEFEAQPAPV